MDHIVTDVTLSQAFTPKDGGHISLVRGCPLLHAMSSYRFAHVQNLRRAGVFNGIDVEPKDIVACAHDVIGTIAVPTTTTPQPGDALNVTDEDEPEDGRNIFGDDGDDGDDDWDDWDPA